MPWQLAPSRAQRRPCSSRPQDYLLAHLTPGLFCSNESLREQLERMYARASLVLLFHFSRGSGMLSAPLSFSQWRHAQALHWQGACMCVQLAVRAWARAHVTTLCGVLLLEGGARWLRPSNYFAVWC